MTLVKRTRTAAARRALAAGLLLAAVAARGAESASRPPDPAHAPAADVHEIRIDPRAFQVVPNDSGPVNYYTVVDDPDGGHIHSEYKPSYETTVLGWGVPEDRRHSVARIRWRWRAVTLPDGGNECQSGKNDSAAVVYLTWKRLGRWYGLKYVWSSVGPRGATCDKRRNILRAQDTVVVESGGPLGEWRTVDLVPDVEFRKHFERGATSEPAAFQGIGIMSDGDQTHSESSADFGGFVVTFR